MFLTGTDEHGLKVAAAPPSRASNPREWADRTSERYRDAWRLLDITNTDFIRTTEPRHYKAVQQFLQRVYDNGFIELGTYEGLYCVACEAYYTEDELVDGLCPIHARPVERVTEENYFFALSRFADQLLEHYAEHPDAVQPELRRNEVLGFIKGGLRDFSMSRTSIDWGVPLPWDPAHVTYVWFDALFNYCTRDRLRRATAPASTATGRPTTTSIGKDILRFHAVYWPAMLLAAGEAPPDGACSRTASCSSAGEKMSKTASNQIAPADLVDDFGSDGFRYHFLADQRFGPDGDFSYESMVARYNADLANNFGNLANRVLNMTASYCDGVAPDARADGPLVAAVGARPRRDDRRDGAPRLRGRACRRLGADPRRELLHRGRGALAAPQGGRRRRDRGGARRLPRGAPGRGAARLARDPASERRAVAAPRPAGHPGGPAAARRARRGAGPAGTTLDKGEPLFPRLEG